MVKVPGRYLKSKKSDLFNHLFLINVNSLCGFSPELLAFLECLVIASGSIVRQIYSYGAHSMDRNVKLLCHWSLCGHN